MMNLAVTMLLACAGTSRAAGSYSGPTSQTLEALHGAPVEQGDQVFDGYAARIQTLTPVEFVPLPPAAVPASKPLSLAPAPVTFDSHEVLPGVTLHAPQERPEPRAASASSRAGGYAAVAVGGGAVAAGLIVGGSLLLPLAGAGAALIVLGAYFLLRS
jgi:hypothetical protein